MSTSPPDQTLCALIEPAHGALWSECSSGNDQHSSGSQGAGTTLTWIQRFGLKPRVIAGSDCTWCDSVIARQSDIHPSCSLRWWGYQRFNGNSWLFLQCIKNIWVFTWTLSRFTGHVSWRPIRVQYSETKYTNERPRHVSLDLRRPESVSRGQKYDDTFHIFHAPWSFWMQQYPGPTLSRNKFLTRDHSLTSFSQSQAESVSNISSQLPKHFSENNICKIQQPNLISYLSLTRTIEHCSILPHIIWCPHISDSSWLDYLWQFVIHRDQWEAELSSDWPIRGKDGELLQQWASSHHWVEWPHSSAFS